MRNSIKRTMFLSLIMIALMASSTIYETLGAVPNSLKIESSGSISYSNPAPTLMLVSSWNFDEVGGTLANDSSGNGNSATIYGSPNWVTGISGDALSFPGNATDYVRIPNNWNLQITGDLTISCWVNIASLSKQALVYKYWGGEFALYLQPNGGVTFAQTSLESFVISPGSVKAGTWTQITVTRHATSKVITGYVNGVASLSCSYSVAPTSSTKDVLIGVQDAAYNPLNGAIDEVQIYNRALSSEEIHSSPMLPTTPTLTPSPNPTSSPSSSITSTITSTLTPSPNPTPSPSFMSTPTSTASPSSNPTTSPSPSSTPTLIPTLTPSPNPTPSPTSTQSPTPTSTSSPTPTPVPTSTQSPTPTPTQSTTPTPSPTSPPPTSSGSLALSVFGDDYLIWCNWNGDPNYWSSQLHWFTEYKCKAARLSFTFADDTGTDKDSTYSRTKMNTVLSLLSSVGVKPILCNFAGANSHFYGSTAWVNDWKGLTTDFKGDSRIKAFEICNEPYDNYLASNANTMSTFNTACASLIDQIRAIDSSRTIMYPIEVGVMTDSASAFYNDIVAKGIPAKGNMLYDILHPYYFESYPNMDPVNNPTGDADWYWNNYALPQINYFGAANCWCGETFPWAVSGGGWNGKTTIHYAYQQTFEIRIINYCISVGMGFQMWCFFSRTDQQTDIDALNNSNYYTLIHS